LQADIEAVARAIGACEVVDCSAKTNEGLESVFDLPVGAIRERFQRDSARVFSRLISRRNSSRHTIRTGVEKA
jgi:hypothetical protein